MIARKYFIKVISQCFYSKLGGLEFLFECKRLSVIFNLKMAQFKPGQQDIVHWLEQYQNGCHPSVALLPELWSSGFNRKLLITSAQRYNGYVLALQQLAVEQKMAIAGTLVRRNKENKLTNRFVFIGDKGNIVAQYDKIHLFPLTNEQNLFESGKSPVIFSYHGIKFGLATCYDLRFPELFRYYAKHGASIVLLSACFPIPRLYDWGILLKARALENQIFIAAVNAVGSEKIDTEEVEYFGHSMVVAPDGQVIVELDNNETLKTIKIDLTQVARVRKRINYLNDIKYCYT